MFTLKNRKIKEEGDTNLGDLKPYEIAIITEDFEDYYGEIVMRTASDTHFEVMSLSKPSVDRCWTTQSTLRVRKLTKGDEITLVVT